MFVQTTSKIMSIELAEQVELVTKALLSLSSQVRSVSMLKTLSWLSKILTSKFLKLSKISTKNTNRKFKMEKLRKRERILVL